MRLNAGGQGMIWTQGERGKITSCGAGCWGTGVTVVDQPQA